ncbi:hypothetical protein SAMN05443377_103119 [Propionibacterium cyclohexanicum]|uniref:Uncharacterized protein n=1 Tax=Propionibacterium cyclohexanicum TaxID=64702 RepID=A0A1H9QHQ0_9ACTN|nr:DUF6350 family protein [Propionibacterium cyclohexanicum]SER59982.1 hypothetical protein SAMN05443377_103119 [Propionibacterium cyclohexanicum]
MRTRGSAEPQTAARTRMRGPGQGVRWPRRSGSGKTHRRGLSWMAAVPWRLACVLAAFGTAAAGILVVLAYSSLAWLGSGAPGGFEQVVAFSIHAWLLANGVPFVLDGVAVTLVPLGFTAIIVVMVCSLSAAIARGPLRSSRAQPFADRAGLSANIRTTAPGALAMRVGMWFSMSYVLVLVIAVNLLGQPRNTGSAIVGGLIVGGLFALIGAGRALGWRVIGLSHAGWISGLAAGIAVALAAFLLVSSVVFGAAVIAGRQRIIWAHEELVPGALGSVLFSLGQAMWVPNAVLWTGSWLLGAGFTVGTTALYSPVHTQPGIVPAIPLFGALPETSGGSPWGLLWLLSGAACAAIGGVVAVRVRRDEASRRTRATPLRADTAALVGLVVGLGTGLAYCLLELLARGSLGATQLVGLGARLPMLVVLAPTVFGASAMVGGWLAVVLRPLRGDAADRAARAPTAAGGRRRTRTRPGTSGASRS